MSQQDIIDVLKKQDKGMSVREICESIDCYNDTNRIKVANQIRAMLKYGEVLFEEIDNIIARARFKDKPPLRRIRIYKLRKDLR